MPIHFHPEEDNYAGLMDDLEVRLLELRNCAVDTVAYNCTVGSMACPSDLLMGKLEETSGVNAVTTAGSILAALNALGVSRIALATPYSRATNEHEKAYLDGHGIEVVDMIGWISMNGRRPGPAIRRRSSQKNIRTRAFRRSPRGGSDFDQLRQFRLGGRCRGVGKQAGKAGDNQQHRHFMGWIARRRRQ